MKAEQNDIENLAVMLTAAGCNYFMGIPAGDDVMLNYQCTGYHEAPALRQLLGVKPISEFNEWAIGMGILLPDGRLGPKAGDASLFM
jgi:ethanolamine ammonia-lyase large subunit